LPNTHDTSDPTTTSVQGDARELGQRVNLFERNADDEHQDADREDGAQGEGSQTVKAGAWSTQLEGRVGHGIEKVGEKRRSREACNQRAILGGARRGQYRGRAVRYVGQKARSSRTRENKKPSTWSWA